MKVKYGNLQHSNCVKYEMSQYMNDILKITKDSYIINVLFLIQYFVLMSVINNKKKKNKKVQIYNSIDKVSP